MGAAPSLAGLPSDEGMAVILSSRRRTALMCGVALGVVFALTGGAGASSSAEGRSLRGDGIGTAKFKEQALSGTVSSRAETIPNFTSAFTDPTNGRTYHYTMVGTNPANGNVTTTIPTEIIPMRFVFDVSADPNVRVLDGTDKLAATMNSPVFQSADIGTAANTTASEPPQPPDTPPGVAPDPRVINEPSDVTQVGDAIYRAQWNKSGTGYHVLLGTPTVTATQTIAVPKNQGQIVVGSRSHADIGLVSYSWFTSHLTNLLVSMKISPHVLPIFLVNNTFLYVQTPGNCCILGYHGATSSVNGNGTQQVNTYMFASYSQQGIFSANAGDTESFIADIHALSHEVQEWYDDPFVNNIVDPWLTPTAPQYGCTSYLETGDPVVGYGFKVTLGGITYHPEDEVHFSWFARESPSRAAQGYYTYLNNFADVAQGC
ncbi:MAG: hypothetical protein ABJA86_07015 [Nocardioidaceae bacterium]